MVIFGGSVKSRLQFENRPPLQNRLGNQRSSRGRSKHRRSRPSRSGTSPMLKSRLGSSHKFLAGKSTGVRNMRTNFRRGGGGGNNVGGSSSSNVNKRGQARGYRNRRSGRGRGWRNFRNPDYTPLTKQDLDNQLDEYMSRTKASLDAELDSYMSAE